MSKFVDLVSDILLEQPVPPAGGNIPDWLKKIIEKHNSLFGTTYPTDKLPPGIYQFVHNNVVNQKDMSAMQQYVHLVAFFRFLIDRLKSKPNTEAEF